jgi:predicted SnoaL-like aldol condensation-catalyzing enzyme
MKLCIFVIALVAILPGRILAGETEETNKALALKFYEQVWFSHNPAAVDELVAPTYFAHDIGERKNVTETAERQKEIAEYFWQRGTMTGKVDFQIAEGDLVATRWQWDFTPSSWWMKALGGRRPLPIINVFRFKDGKIVEIWNHRHDIDGGMGNLLFVKGILVGLIPSVAMLAIIFVRRRRTRKMRNEASTADVTA